jgi:hypothetical protein
MASPVRAPVEVAFKATGVEQVRNGLRLVGKEGEQHLHRLGNSSRQLAGGLEMIARQGKVTGEAMKQIIAQGAEMAFMFGPAGGVVGALAITGMAIYEHITGKMKEAEDQAKKTRTEIGALANNSNGQGLIDRAKDLYFGTPFDENGNLRNPSATKGAFQGSLADLEARNRMLQGQMQPGGNLLADIANAKTKRAIDELAPSLAKARKEFELIRDAITVMRGQPAAMAGIPPVHSKALSPEALAARNAYFANQRFEFMQHFTTGGPATIQQYKPAANLRDISGTIGAIGYASASVIKPTDTQKLIGDFNNNLLEPIKDSLREGTATTFGDAIAEGITAGIQNRNVGAAFEAGGKALLSGIGHMISEEGQVWIKYGILKTGLFDALSLNPLTSGPAAIAKGAALVALGAGISSIWSGRSSGGGGGSGGAYSASSSMPQIIDRGMINPNGALVSAASAMTARTPIAVTIIGPNDPQAQRQITELIRNADRRSA